MNIVIDRIGSDSEYFFQKPLKEEVIDGETRYIAAKIVPAIGLVGGTKENPLPIEGLPLGFAVQEDNVMAEGNIPAAKDAKEFSDSFGKLLTHLQNIAHSHKLELSSRPIAFFQPEELESNQAKTIGCEPDFCVWTRKRNPIDNEHPILRILRSTGGHIHVSFFVDKHEPSMEDREWFVKGMDTFLTIPLMLRHLSSSARDDEKLRKMLYGKAGAFRPKDYGIEYRVLSNFWTLDVATRLFTFNQVQNVGKYLGNSRVRDFIEALGPKIRGSIDSFDMEQMKTVHDRGNKLIVDLGLKSAAHQVEKDGKVYEYNEETNRYHEVKANQPEELLLKKVKTG